MHCRRSPSKQRGQVASQGQLVLWKLLGQPPVDFFDARPSGRANQDRGARGRPLGELLDGRDRNLESIERLGLIYAYHLEWPAQQLNLASQLKLECAAHGSIYYDFITRSDWSPFDDA